MRLRAAVVSVAALPVLVLTACSSGKDSAGSTTAGSTTASSGASVSSLAIRTVGTVRSDESPRSRFMASDVSRSVENTATSAWPASCFSTTTSSGRDLR
jgi:hypothetical protein